MNLEDETGLINIVVSVGCWKRFRPVARDASALLIRGRLQRTEGVVNVIAELISPLTMAVDLPARNFR
jgi:error-prone DNA polymerase